MKGKTKAKDQEKVKDFEDRAQWGKNEPEN